MLRYKGVSPYLLWREYKRSPMDEIPILNLNLVRLDEGTSSSLWLSSLLIKGTLSYSRPLDVFLRIVVHWKFEHPSVEKMAEEGEFRTHEYVNGSRDAAARWWMSRLIHRTLLHHFLPTVVFPYSAMYSPMYAFENHLHFQVCLNI